AHVDHYLCVVKTLRLTRARRGALGQGGDEATPLGSVCQCRGFDLPPDTLAGAELELMYRARRQPGQERSGTGQEPDKAGARGDVADSLVNRRWQQILDTLIAVFMERNADVPGQNLYTYHHAGGQMLVLA